MFIKLKKSKYYIMCVYFTCLYTMCVCVCVCNVSLSIDMS